MDTFLSEIDRPLSTTEVIQIVGNHIKFVPFSKIRRIPLDDLFINDRCLINYLSSPRMGHWVAMIRDRATKEIKYFNPSGSFPDMAIEFLPEYKNVSDQAYPHLLKKFEASDYEISYVSQQLQEPGSNSCGRWAGLFMRFPDISVEKFEELFGNLSNLGIIRLTNELAKSNH